MVILDGAAAAPAAGRRAASGGIRPLEEHDLAQIATLRARCFRTAWREAPGLAQARLRRRFLEHPWERLGVRSLVWADSSDRILGFGGLLGRPMRFEGRDIVVALSCQVMVDPPARGRGIAEALLRASTEGPQLCTFSDILNPPMAGVWRRIGGVELPELELHWARPLRPFRWLAARAGRGGRLAWVLRAAGPGLSLLDALLRRTPGSAYHQPRTITGTLRPLAPETHLEELESLAGRYELAPVYDAASLAWVLERAREGLRPGDRLEAHEVLDEGGARRGFFVVVVRPGRSAGVVQLGICGDDPGPVIAALAQRCDEAGCVAVGGRLQPEHLGALATWPAHLGRGDPRIMAVSREPALIASLRSGRGWLSHLEGEWWLGF